MNRNNKYTIITIHILVWVVLFALPYLLSAGGDAPELDRTIRHNWIPLVLYAIIFYVNYLYLIEKFLFPRKFLLFFGLNVLLFSALMLLKQSPFLNEMLPIEMEKMKPLGSPPPRNFFIYLDTISFLVPLIFAIALRVGERWLKAEADKKEAENIRLQSELQHLKYQLQPHFFFNSLNNIYSLVDLSPDKAKETIHTLSKLMRYMLYESSAEKVSLQKEVEFMEKYIELMKLRSRSNVTVNHQFSPINSSTQIQPLLFISLIENAFKHGVSATKPSNLEFNLKDENGLITFTSQNTNFQKTDIDKSGSGIGLDNLIKRLQLLYPEKHQLEIRNQNDTYRVELIINNQ